MKIQHNIPPRVFTVPDKVEDVQIADVAHLWLEADEQITLITHDGNEYDIARKSWGYYATPSLNRRLKQFNLRSALVRSYHHTYFIMMAERGHEEAFFNYLAHHDQRFITWLDEDSVLQQIDRFMTDPDQKRCPICGDSRFSVTFHYTKPHVLEGHYRLDPDHYDRKLYCCQTCGHYISVANIDLGFLYDGEYVDATYVDLEGIRKTFNKIIHLDPTKSDNVGRAKRVVAFAEKFMPHQTAPTLLDVGSGLGVFPYEIRKYGWQPTALDPDRRATQHLTEDHHIPTITADFMLATIEQTFDVITFNKVLEHVNDPVAMLKRAGQFLNDDGFIYVELPDGEVATRYGAEREEIMIDHLHVFSMTSLVLLAQRAGFTVYEAERLHEPSTKYTLRVFMGKQNTIKGN